MAPTAADIPSRYDVIINGVGYRFYEPDGGKKFGYSDVQASFQYTPTFVQKSNVTGDFGDNQQDFWLTFTQRDWSLGENLRYQRAADTTSTRRFWQGSAVEIGKPGQVTLKPTTSTLSPAALPTAICGGTTTVFFTTSTKLYSIDTSGTITDLGAHGAGASPTCMVFDPSGDLYFAGASTGVRKWNGSAFSDFSATSDTYLSLEYNANTLYACTSSILYSFDTSGTRTAAFPWKGADGAAYTDANVRLRAFGGRTLILRGAVATGAELWMYDGTGVYLIAKFPVGFKADGLAVLNGAVFVGGVATTYGSASSVKPTIYYYANGTIDKLWEAYTTGTSSYMPLEVWQGGLVFVDSTRTGNPLVFYNPSTGGTSHLADTTSAPAIGATKNMVAVAKVDSGTSIYFHPTSTTSTSGYVISSLIDFESSLTKVFRGVKVEWEAGSGGDGGSVDVAYRLEDVDSTYTSLQTGAVSGTEYTFSGVTGRAISIKVTLNKGTSTNGPKLKRIAVRAAPKQPPFRRASYILNLTGVDGTNPVKLNDGTFQASDGMAQATNLSSVVNTATPVTIIDEIGTYTGIIEGDSFELRRISPNEFVGFVQCREV